MYYVIKDPNNLEKTIEEIHAKNLFIHGIFTNTELNVINIIHNLLNMKKVQCQISVISGEDESPLPFPNNGFFKGFRNPNEFRQFLFEIYYQAIQLKDNNNKNNFAFNNVNSTNKYHANMNNDTTSLNLKVLAVDDNETNQLVVSKMLKKLGCTYKIVSNGTEAVNTVFEEDFDLILMDQFMPILSGPDAARIVREKGGKYATIPIIAMTASILPEDEHECISAGMNGFISKPVTLKILNQKLLEFCPKT